MSEENVKEVIEESKKEESEKEEVAEKPSFIPEDVEVREERVYTIPLWKSWVRKGGGYHRAKKAMTFLKKFIARHMRNEDISIDPRVNEIIWKNGIRNPPRKVKVKVVLGSDERVYILPWSEEE